MRPAEQLGTRSPGLAAAVGIIAVGVAVAALMWAIGTATYEVWGGLLVALGLLVLSAPLLARATAAEPDHRIRQLIVLALLLKLAFAAVRYFVAFDVYEGVADAAGYAGWGARLAGQFRDGTFAVDVGRGLVGTGFIRYLTGLVFAVTGHTALGGFFVFSWLAFWGLYGFYRAFRLALPDADHHRYALVVFLLPSLLFWPSSLGKEAVMVTALGLAAYGAAKVFTRNGGYLLFAAGLGLTALVRPHITLILAAAALAGFARRVRPARPPLFGPAGQLVGLALLVVATLFALDVVERHFNLIEEGEGFQQLLEFNLRQTAQGGSEFPTTRVSSPAQVPRAAVTVLFRPFPFEATNPQQLATAVEGLFLLALTALSWRRLWAGARLVLANPYARFAAVFAILFILGFATVGNFGILARQRAQLFPFFLVFLSLAPVARAARRERVVA